MAERVALMRSLIAKEGGASSAQAWSALWKGELTLWDLGKPTETMLDEVTKALAGGRVPQQASVFIPGCGSGYDVHALARKGFSATGLDVAPEAIAKAESLQDTAYTTSLICGDFFTHALPTFDLVFDYTFFCALPPSLRSQWGARTASLIKPGGRLLTLAYPLATEEMASNPEASGPPFPVSISQYRLALEPHGIKLEGEPYKSDLTVANRAENQMVAWWVKE